MLWSQESQNVWLCNGDEKDVFWWRSVVISNVWSHEKIHTRCIDEGVMPMSWRCRGDVLRNSHTHWLCFNYETYIGISQYALCCTTCIHVVCKLYSRWMLLTERRRFTTLWSSVMSVDYTIFCTVERFGQSCEKIQTVLIFVRYGKIQHMSKE